MSSVPPAPVRVVAVGDPAATADARSVIGFLRRVHLRVDTTVDVVTRLRPAGPPPGEWARRSVVVDDLRTWSPARRVESVAGPVVAGRLRGLRLRAWLRRLDPTVIVRLDGDDDLADRVRRSRPIAVLRVAGVDADAPLDAPSCVRWHGEELWLPPIVDGNHARGAATAEQRAETRRRLGVAAEEVMVGVVAALGDTDEADRVAASIAGGGSHVRVRRVDADAAAADAFGDGWRLEERTGATVAEVAACDVVVAVGVEAVWAQAPSVWAHFAGVPVAVTPRGGSVDAAALAVPLADDVRDERIGTARRLHDVASVADRWVADLGRGGSAR